MREFTIISNSSDTVLYMKVQDKSSFHIIAELFTGEPDSSKIPSIQTASAEFKNRLHLLDIMGQSSYVPKKFLNDIPNNQCFLLRPGHIDDILIINYYKKLLSSMNGIPLNYTDMDGVIAGFSALYEVRLYRGDSRQKIGVYEKEKRICRFCGKSLPTIKFNQKAHAISESLGNKGLVCLEECDDCNKRFNETIEQDISNLLRFHLMLKGVKGKNGNPTIKGDGISITNDTSSRFTTGRDTIVIEVEKTPYIQNLQDLIPSYLQKCANTNTKYTPQNIYKCLCKYVISLLDSQYLPYFKDTINWINEPLVRHRFPPIWYYNLPSGMPTSLIIMTRKLNNQKIPYCWAILSVAGFQIIFIVPFCNLDRYKFVGKKSLKYFLNGLENLMPNVKLYSAYLNGITPIRVKNDFHFEILPVFMNGDISI